MKLDTIRKLSKKKAKSSNPDGRVSRSVYGIGIPLPHLGSFHNPEDEDEDTGGDAADAGGDGGSV